MSQTIEFEASDYCPSQCESEEDGCKFVATVTYDEVTINGWIYFKNVTVQLVKPTGCSACKPEAWSIHLVEDDEVEFVYKPSGDDDPPVRKKVTDRNIRFPHDNAKERAQGIPETHDTEGFDVDYWDDKDDPVSKDKDGKPYKIRSKPGEALTGFTIRFELSCACGCVAPKRGRWSQTLKVEVKRSRHRPAGP